ncbi:LxmA leader domain family RiPP [Microbacterium hibisci]|uniref:LxmA leader domain family RiPP n=1 Tax=Microbacterium hibisci TaxID=2036000 RepID=UPI00194222CD|nr:LxmA leader domain family RiPP [Microbacterium hibisci]
MKTDQIMKLVEGYDAYCDVDEIATRQATDAPATTAYCGLVGITWLSGMLVTQTINAGC